jgi:hypothetical protein
VQPSIAPIARQVLGQNLKCSESAGTEMEQCRKARSALTSNPKDGANPGG